MTAFNVGDVVTWPIRWGWHRGEVTDRAPYRLERRDELGRTWFVDSLRLTLYDYDTGRHLSRDIASCCAMIPGPHVRRLAAH